MAKGRSEFYYSEKRKQYRKRIVIDGRQRDVWGDTKAAVRLRIEELRNAEKSGLILGDSTTVAEYAARWFEVKKEAWQHKSRAGYASVINNHICPAVGSMRLKDVKPLHLEAILAKKIKSYVQTDNGREPTMVPMSRALQDKIVAVIKQIFLSAEDNGLILKSPCRNLKASGGSPRPHKALSDDQFNEIMEQVEGTRALTFVALGLYAGLRREESLGLLWDCVFLDAKTPYLSVRRVVRFEGNTGILSEVLKSNAATRDIPLASHLADILRAQKQIANSVFVVPASDGKQMSAKMICNLWERVRDTISFDTTPHCLRHTFITKLCASGMDIKRIQYLAGHATVQMTLNVYAAVTANRPADLGESLNRAFK